MRKVLTFLASAGAGQCLPRPTFEFLGSRNSAIFSSSINPRLGFDVLDVAGHCVGVDRAVVDLHLAALAVVPGQGVLHPVFVVAGGEVLAAWAPRLSCRFSAPLTVTMAWQSRL